MAPTANLLSGGIDEAFTRTDSAGARHFLADALGSMLALTDSTGTIQTSYTYEPFGNATPSGASSASPYQYTGRENDGDALYFYRARYYSPALQRFISEDPLGLAGGDPNEFAYVANNPANYSDGYGLYVGADDLIFTGGGAIVGLASQGVHDLFSAKLSGWQDYVGSAVGGAIGGEALLYTGPVVAGATASFSGNLTTQSLNNLTGRSCGYSASSLAFSAALGGLLGKFGSLVYPGLTEGANSYNAIFKQMLTKFDNNAISGVTVQTAFKMFVGRAVDTGLLPAGLVGGAISAVRDGSH